MPMQLPMRPDANHFFCLRVRSQAARPPAER